VTSVTNPKAIIDEVFREYRSVNLGFVESDYWETLRLTYERTLKDVVQLVEHHFEESRRIRILEIGAFCGTVATALKRTDARFEITAWDLPLFMEDEALVSHYVRTGIQSASGNLCSLPLDFAPEAFEIIICCEVIEHLNFNPLPVFCEFNRLLKAGGILYIGTPNQANIVKRLLLAKGKSIHNPVKHLVWQLNPKESFSIGLHWKEYTAAELVEVLSLTGFQCSRSYYCHTNEHLNPNVLRRMLVRLMYSCFPAFLPSQVAIGVKTRSCNVQALAPDGL